MPYKRGKVHKVELKAEDKAILEKLAMRHKLSMKEIAGYLIVLCDKYDLMEGDWQARLKGEEEDRDRYTGLEGACGNMTFAKEDYICVRAVLGKPPSIKKLSDTIDEALGICAICEEDTRKKLDRDLTLERVHELETQLEVRASEKFKVPNCNYGAHLADNGSSFQGCRLNPGKTVDVQNYCKKRLSGKPCSSYTEILIAVGDARARATRKT